MTRRCRTIASVFAFKKGTVLDIGDSSGEYNIESAGTLAETFAAAQRFATGADAPRGGPAPGDFDFLRSGAKPFSAGVNHAGIQTITIAHHCRRGGRLLDGRSGNPWTGPVSEATVSHAPR